MSNTHEKKYEKQPHPELDDEQPAEPVHTHVDDAEIVRQGSQTSQDRDHTIRGGDDRTGPMKEFPT